MPYNPHLQRVQAITQVGLGSSPFARHYSGNHFSFLGYLDVSVPPVPSTGLCVQPAADRVLLGRVSPFGYLRIFALSQLPVAFRSPPRPSSALGAKASTVCP